jgi:hypothetical protein
LSHLLTLEVALKSIEEESIVWYAVPVEYLLLLLCPNAVVLVQEIQETTLGLFEGGIGAGLEISQIREDSLLKLLGVLYWTPKCLETKGKTSYNIGTRDVKKIVPEPMLATAACHVRHNAGIEIDIP